MDVFFYKYLQNDRDLTNKNWEWEFYHQDEAIFCPRISTAVMIISIAATVPKWAKADMRIKT